MNQICSDPKQNDRISTMTNNSNNNNNNNNDGDDETSDEKVVQGPTGPEQTSRENSPTITNNNHKNSKKYHGHHLPFSIDALVGDVCNKTKKKGAVNDDCSGDGDGDCVGTDSGKSSKNMNNGLPIDLWHQQMAEMKRIQQIYYQKFYNLNEYPITTSFPTIPTVPNVVTSLANNNCDLSRYLESQEQLLAYYTNLFLQNSYQDHYLNSLKKYSTTVATAALSNNNDSDHGDEDDDGHGNIQNVVKSSNKTLPLLLNRNDPIKKHSKSNSERFNSNHNADNYGDIVDGDDDDEDDDGNDGNSSTSTANDDSQRPQCSNNNDNNDANCESVSNAKLLSSSSPTNKINNPYQSTIGTLKNNSNHSVALINDRFIDLRQTSNSDLNINDDDHQHPNDNGRLNGQNNYYKSFQSYCDYDSLKAKTSNHHLHHQHALLSNNNNENTGDNLSPISSNQRILQHSPSPLSASSSLVASSSPTNPTITETINNSVNDNNNETIQPTTSNTSTGSQVTAAAAAFHFSNMFRKPKRIRTAFSPGQLLRLEEIFEKNRYVVGCERKQLARDLNLSETQIKVWFQNRRTKHKREKHINGSNHHHHHHHHHNHHHHSNHHHSSSSSSSSPSASNHLLSHSFRSHSHSQLGADVKKFYGRSLNLSSMDITGSYLSNNNTAAFLSSSSSSSPSMGTSNTTGNNGINVAFNFKNSTNSNNPSRTLLAK